MLVNKHRNLIIKIIIGVMLFIALIVVLKFLLELNVTLCVFTNLFGVECYGCGMTRAYYALITGKFKEAITHNILIIIVAPLTIILFLKYVYKKLKL